LRRQTSNIKHQTSNIKLFSCVSIPDLFLFVIAVLLLQLSYGG